VKWNTADLVGNGNRGWKHRQPRSTTPLILAVFVEGAVACSADPLPVEPDGGVRAESVPDWRHCKAVPPPLPQECSPAQICAALDCEKPWSWASTTGCMRKPCTSDRACAPDERCYPTVLHPSMPCVSTVLEGCAPEPGQDWCSCQVSADCGARIHCVRIDDAPPSTDCQFPRVSCDVLRSHFHDVNLVLDDAKNMGAEVRQRLQTCVETMEKQRISMKCAL
jgi:hypothetical protein